MDNYEDDTSSFVNPSGQEKQSDPALPTTAPWGTHKPEASRAPKAPTPTGPIPEGVSPRLYNSDLAPTTRAGRTWNAYSIFTLWANDVHSLGNYTFAMGLFALGLGGWQIMLAFLLGGALLFVLLNLSGFMGERTGVPFPVMSRIAFGLKGAKVPSIVRGSVAIAWFGIQTYLASVVLRVLIVALFPSAASLDQNSFLGLSTLGWITFFVLWLVQLLIVVRGMEMIRKYEAMAGPIILVTFLLLAGWMLYQADFSIAWSTSDSLTGLAMWVRIFESAALWVVIYGTFVLNFCDFTRGAPSQKSVVRGNFYGIPINMLFFGLIVVTLTGSQYAINGTIIDSPTDVVEAIPNTFFLVLACLSLIILTIAVNLMANFVAPIYMFTKLFPRHLNFPRSAVLSAVIGILILPWNMYNSPVVIVYFLGGLGALLGPVFGVMMSDYWIVRRGRINVPDLYKYREDSDYYYSKGVNRKALIAGTPAASIALIIALVPTFEVISGFSWFIGAIMAAVIYILVTDTSKRDFTAQDGEAIAVRPTH